ncbi:DctP family TRAP transporter solute-binding subunit [Sediminibacillus dalangtanensis]|uniref:DctP family TRAP transporter solute-binding subunit n=1 Tax=Sediminibacillus dalangtanensis TaxID=2729421 RepID=A0ABX7VV54_9BACI|nr:TRAP transporter substrate-binding protein [Sediminibacillus dalangtanensis]QTN00419.1 DctP family TRAP transporter solute-binding subunit [Sediminibacillus dalangtanensis]
MKKRLGVIFSALILSVMTACGGAETEDSNAAENGSVNLIAATQLNSDSAFAAGFEKFKEVIESETDGDVTVEIHTDGDLGGNEDELVQNLESGSVDLVVASPGFMTQAVQDVDFFALPYLFESRDHWKKVVNGEVGETIFNRIEENTSFKMLGYWSAGVRNYYGFKPVEKPEDLKGVKVRVQNSPVVQDTWKAFGAQPANVAWNEMYQALQNKVIDAAENDFTNIYQASHYELADYISETEHDFTTRLFFTADRVYDQLNDEQKAAFDKAAEEATKAALEADDKLAEESLKAMEEQGVKVNEVDKQPFIDATEQIRQDAVKKLGMEDLYQKVQDLK